MKKILAVLLITVLMFGLAACGYDEGSEPGVSTEVLPKSSACYIGNKQTKIFHTPSCYPLPKEKNRIYFSTRDEAVKNNYSPCENCNP